MALEAALSPFTWSISSLKGLRLDLIVPFYLFQFNALDPKIKIWIFLLLPLFISYRSNVEKLMKYQANSFCVIMSVILMTTLLYKALIFQREIWCWSLLGLKGLRGASFLTVESNIIIEIKLVHFLTINEWGWVSYEELWRWRTVLSVEAEADNTRPDLHNTSYDTKAQKKKKTWLKFASSIDPSMLSSFSIVLV